MRKPKKIDLVLLPLAASTVMACQDPYYQHCVDPTGNVVPDSQCQHVVYVNGIYPYRWYYGSQPFGVGDRIYGGSYTRSVNRTYVPLTGRSSSSGGFFSSSRSPSFSSSPSSISRGGFGSSHSSFSGGSFGG